MKQQSFKIGNKEYLVLDIPKETMDIELDYDNNILLYNHLSFNENECGYYDLPSGQWSIIGTIPGITEDEAAKIVEYIEHPPIYQPNRLYRDYQINFEMPDCCNYITALESLSSLMRSLGIYTENPFGSLPNEDDFVRYPLPLCFDPNGEIKELYLRKKRIEREWQEAEDNLWQKIVLLEKI